MEKEIIAIASKQVAKYLTRNIAFLSGPISGLIAFISQIILSAAFEESVLRFEMYKANNKIDSQVDKYREAKERYNEPNISKEEKVKREEEFKSAMRDLFTF